MSASPPGNAPLELFQRWFDEARAAGEPQPETMALATATPDGRPSLRFVLYRGISGDGLRFFTNYESRKSEELATNAAAAVAFYWHAIGRQVRVEGRTERLPAAESDAYFSERPRPSQLAAWASPQSRPLPYAELERRYAEVETAWEGRPVARPPFWGGFLLRPERFELWEGRMHRLHLRLVYTRDGDGAWRSREIAP
jgi:pyridoxamine 5'-phosphate oxidase